MEPAGDETKKAVCRGLTGILKESPLSSSVDPKSFFMMLSTNYSALTSQAGQIDLSPVFEALRASAPEDRLLPVFLKFEEMGSELGLSVKLPDELAQLAEADRAVLLARYEAQRGLAEVPPEDLEDGPEDEETARHRQIVNTFIQGFRRSPLGKRFEASQLSYFVSQKLDEMLTDDLLELGPVVDGLREQGVTDAEIYVGVALATDRLQSIDIRVEDPTLDVRPEMRSQLVKEALAAEAAARAPRAPSTTSGQPSKTEEERRQKLEDFGLSGRKSRNPKKAQRIRMLVMAAMMAGIVAFGFATRPNRSMATAPFAKAIPLKSAKMVDGAFSATIDWQTWSKLAPQTQRLRVQAYEKLLRSKGLYQDSQLRGPDDNILLAPVHGGKGLKASPKLFGDYVEKSQVPDEADEGSSPEPDPDTEPSSDDADAINAKEASPTP